ncbi:hypothetical protein, partial [Vibrio parahaemolyticus]|uniref:hypothetical protein n=1 Tax=Vibrio parahaemolyticus TaxID=670 RepID=UPI00116EDA2D
MIHDIHAPLKEALRLNRKSIYLFRLPEVEAKPQYEKVFEQLCKHCKLDYKSYQYSLYSYR